MMSTYFVRTASVYRNAGILGVDVLELNADRGLKLEVIGEPDKHLKFRTVRPVYDEAGNAWDRCIIVIEPPDFPIQALIGQRIIDKSD